MPEKSVSLDLHDDISAGSAVPTHIDGLLGVGLLYDTDSSVGDEDKEDHEWLNECRHPATSRFRRVFKACQDERDDR